MVYVKGSKGFWQCIWPAYVRFPFIRGPGVCMKIALMSLMVIFYSAGVTLAAAPDFGPDGLKGLSTAQQQKLAQGQIVFTFTDSSTQAHAGLIEAAVIFDRSPEETWRLLTRVEDQYKYLKEVAISRAVGQSIPADRVFFTVKAAMVSVDYRVVYTYDQTDAYFHWTLDPGFRNDLADLRGFWRIYPYGQGKSLARYGSNVSVKNVPGFIEDMFKKSGVSRSLVSVKKYVDSGGTYHK